MAYIKDFVKSYLDEFYSPDMRGVDLSTKFDIPPRSARRYLANYRMLLAEQVSPRMNINQETMGAVVFDIETTDFGTEGHSGWLVCCSFLPIGGTVETIETPYDAYGDDRETLKKVARKLSHYSFQIGHNIAAYDYNWLNSRLMFHGLPTLDSAYYFDTYQVARTLGIATRKSLGNLIDYFNLDGVKTTIYKTSWSRVRSSDPVEFEAGMSEVVEHCEMDVEANRALFDVLHHRSKLNGRANAWKATKMKGNYWKHEQKEKETAKT